MRRILMLSDLHFGSPSANPDIVLQFLANTEFDELILVGDILHFHGDSNEKWKLIFFLRDLIEQFNKRIIWLIGNHDDDMGVDEAGYSLWKKEMETVLPGVIFAYDYVYSIYSFLRILFLHGHQLTGDDSSFTRLVVKSFGAIQDFFGPKFRGVYKAIDTLERVITGSYKRVREGAIKRALLGKYHIVVCGHSHKEEISVHQTDDGQSILYLNTGDWLGKRKTFPYIMMTLVDPDGINMPNDYVPEVELSYYKPS